MRKIYLSVRFGDTREGTISANFEMFVAKQAPTKDMTNDYNPCSPVFHFCFPWKHIINLKSQVKKLEDIHGGLYLLTTCDLEGIGHCCLVVADSPTQITADMIKNPLKYKDILTTSNEAWQTIEEITRWSAQKLWHKLNSTFLSGENHYEIRIHNFVADLNKDNPKIVHCHSSENGYFELGFAYLREKYYRYAIRNFNCILEISSQPEKAYRAKGLCHSYLGEYQAAIDNYNKAIQIDPKTRFTYALRADTYKQLQQYQAAITDYDTAIKIKPHSPRCYHDRGFCYSHLGEHQKAIEDYSTTIQIDPHYKWAYFNRGLIYKDLKEYKKALADFDKVIVIDPYFKLAYKHRGDIYQEQNKEQKNNTKKLCK